MTDTTAPLNVTATEEVTINAPARAYPGGGTSDQGGVMRSRPGDGVEDLGSGERQQINPDDNQTADDGKATPPVEETPKVEPEVTPKVEPTPTPEATPEELPPELKAKMEPFSAEVATSGTLSDESVTKAAAEFGVSEAMVRTYVKGATAEAAPVALSEAGQATVSAAYELVGGEANHAGFVQWMTENHPDAMDDLATAADSAKPSILKAVMGPHVEAWKASGTSPMEPRRITQEGTGNGGEENTLEGFDSRDEQLKAMRDKRYGKDRAYTTSTDLRIAASTWASQR